MSKSITIKFGESQASMVIQFNDHETLNDVKRKFVQKMVSKHPEELKEEDEDLYGLYHPRGGNELDPDMNTLNYINEKNSPSFLLFKEN